MRRPLCLFCAGALGVELVCAFLPQAGLWLPFAAFFVAGMLFLVLGGKARGYGLCLVLGALAGVGFTAQTRQNLARVQDAYAEREVSLTAEVETAAPSYYPGVVRAALRVETVNGEEADFRFVCAALPECEAGDRIAGRFQLEAPDREVQISSYADGIALSGEYRSHFTFLGQSGSFRARTHRWQKRLSTGLQAALPERWPDTAGVLAAMVTGDRSAITPELKTAYRLAGLSHVLVVSGMHVAILCGGVFRKRPRSRKAGRKEPSHWHRKAAALGQAWVALLLVGITGFTPSVLRAAAAIWIGALGVWWMAPADALTSLAAAGLWMTCTNAYAACDVGFELSFAAVVGTLAGGAVVQRLQKGRTCRPRKQTTALCRRACRVCSVLLNALCIPVCASLATFPVLVLRGMSASLYAVVSGVAVLWLVEPILLFGVLTALLSLLPWAAPARFSGFCAAGLTELLDRWAVWVAGWPGAQLWFDTAYAAVVCLVLLVLGWLAYRWKIRFRVALPALLLTAAVAITVGNALTRDLVRVELVGSAKAPAVILTQRETAVVLFRGGADNQRAVENQLVRRGIRQAAVRIDLRMNPETPCTLPAEQTIAAASMGVLAHREVTCGGIAVEVLRTREGCVVRATAAGRQLVTLSGTVRLAKPLRADWLLASMSRPGSVLYRDLLTLRTDYRWITDLGEATVSGRLLLRPEGGEQTLE